MSRRSLAMRGLVPVAIALCALASTSTVAWADPAPPPPHPAPAPPHPAPAPARPAPAPPHQPPPPAPINNDLCIRDHGRVVVDPHNPGVRHCVGGPHNGVVLR